MTTAYHRFLVLVTGQSDCMATPSDSRMFDEDMHPDFGRCILPPPPVEVDPAYRAKVLRGAIVISLALWLGLVALLRMFGARTVS